jgi:hypothetical protein
MRWVSGGVAAARTTYGTWRWDGEVSGVAYSTDGFALGAAVGGGPHRVYAELQPVLMGSLGSGGGLGAGLLFGVNPGVVVDRARSLSVGGQVTVWAWPMIVCCHGGMLPIPVLFGRGEILPSGHVVSFGMMLKISIPFWR